MGQNDNRTQAILSWQRTARVDLRVEQDEQQRYLVLNGQRQSQMQLQQPASPTYPHLLVLLDWLADKPWQSLLQIGLGGGEFNRVLAARWPDCQVVTVEQEPLIIEAYLQFFRPQPHPNETLICADALTFARNALVQPQRFEVIFVDIYPWSEQWQALMPALLQLRAEKSWFCINLPGDPPAQWQAFWNETQLNLQYYKVPGYLNQLWLGGYTQNH